jgi:hypothetical protein
VTTRRYIPDDSELHTLSRENLKSHIAALNFVHRINYKITEFQNLNSASSRNERGKKAEYLYVYLYVGPPGLVSRTLAGVEASSTRENTNRFSAVFPLLCLMKEQNPRFETM